MSEPLQALAQLLAASLDPRQNKEAELKIRSEEKKPGFSLLLLQITASESFPFNTRLASALFFKNFVKRNWADEEGNYKLPQDEVASIKRELIGLMVSVPPAIQMQLGEAISLIADSDFWERWDTLVDDLVSRLTPDNPVVNAGVLQVAHSIFARWRPLFRSDELFTEINHVLNKFSAPFLALWQSLDDYIEQNKTNKTTLEKAFAELDLVIKLLYDLSCQDLPPLFEENLGSLATFLLKYLIYDNELLHTDDESDAGPLENVKADIFDALTLYVQKYYDAFGPHIGQFVGSSWNLLTTVGLDTKNDILVSKALHFLTSITRIQEQSQAFNNADTLNQVVEKVILPNISLRDSDVELFVDEPIEYIRRDLEGSDSETRRRAATDFLRQLMEQFPDLVSQTVKNYMGQYLANYNSNPRANWRSKDTAIYLFCSVAAKGVATASHGVTSTNPGFDIGEFFQNNLANDLVAKEDVEPILKVDAIKFLYLFRSIITKDQWQQIMPLLVNHLGDSNYVVYTYAAVAVERTLYLTDESGRPIIDPSAIVPLSKDLLEHLFSLMEKDQKPEKVQENEFLMRCVMRVLIVIKDGVLPVIDSVLSHLVNITKVICANPSNPRFYYYHFESLGALVRFAGPTQSDKLQQALYEPFMLVLQNGVEEYMPYVFQLFAALLEADPSAALPTAFQPLISPILAPPPWESRGNVPALARLVSSIVSRGAEYLANNNQVEPVLGIFQKLVSTKVHESYGFDLLESVVESFPPAALEAYWIPILQVTLTRLQNSPTQNFTLRFVRFFHFVSSRDDKGLGTDFFVAQCDRVQQDVFRALYLSIILPESQKLVRPLDRKTAVISLTKLLSDSDAFVNRYPRGWPLSCNALLKLLENPPVPATEDAILDHDVEDMSFGVGFTQLQTVRKPVPDPLPEAGDLRKWVGRYLQAADGRHGGRIQRFVAEGVKPEGQQVLATYMQG